ncbi:MAG: hypothetical protein DIZ80_04730 [endosymbiont of Galathealinum brachiosum]|uniref:GGDEF domain-containing protein n=1 Tax=endosymbiont of Galathealinum brachiosum TaxID=2200906 RepID=A0A370DIM7_9GAMM|nr:MAG: hypothetical protein DIZ80_04730 [endosymbiont of Galathealinum brachiosum]
MGNKKTFIIIGLLVFVLDLLFVAVNYSSSNSTLYRNLSDKAQENQRNFNHTLDMTYNSMLQLTTHFSQDVILNDLFLKGKKAVESEGGAAGGEQAKLYRQKLFDELNDGWGEMTRAFNLRQLHYHLGPGSTSFLRVHKPEKYGDNMDDIRHIIIAANDDKKSHTGFEIGRVYSGLRAASPISVIDPVTHKAVHVGVLEIGTSFDKIIPKIQSSYKTNIAILLLREQTNKNVWSQLHKQYDLVKACENLYIESTSSSSIHEVLSRSEIDCGNTYNDVSVIEIDERYISAYFFPLRDFQGENNSALPDIGKVLIWDDVTEQISEFNDNVLLNLLYAVTGLLIVELFLYFIFRYEMRLSAMAMYDTLTGLPNRRYFNDYAGHAISQANRDNGKIAFLYIDLDGFKAINDNISHKAGDMVLIAIAERAKELTRKNELMFRLGGDEFCMVLQNFGTRESVSVIAQRLINRCSEDIAIGDLNVNVGMSIGIAVYPDHATTLEKIVSLADKAMYVVKNNNKGTYQFFSAD